ncbi:hypothetical protein F5Y15DRAFT_109012 [Xylariaceae sp. FL0016]|nr:hypothetical protein F5Y15DRAFT_109012 [Xylariaceae sp. FL0016]
MSHSKRNTSRAVFTSHERDIARRAWTSTSARLTRESFLTFSACRLCLQVARDPVSCTHGDIFCRECALANILAQKQDIKRLHSARAHQQRQDEEDRERQRAEENERAIRDFEMTQSGLRAQAVSAANGKPMNTDMKWRTGSRSNDAEGGTGETDAARPAKRKFEMDEGELARIAAGDRAKARKAIEDEKAARPNLPSFWTPSITPSSNTNDALHEVVSKTKATPICPASPENEPHPYSLHTLVAVHFTEEEEDNGRKQVRICPSCKKGLSNSSKAMLAKPCGHVVCKSCVDKFMRPSKHHDPHAAPVSADALRCYVCDADLVEKPNRTKDDKGKKKKDKEKIRPGLVELRSEGTGFSAGGANQVQKSDVAFQC